MLIIALGMCVLLVVKRGIEVDQMQMMQVEAAAEELLASAVLIRSYQGLRKFCGQSQPRIAMGPRWQ